ncbi:zinc finger (CCCH-type) family protein [Actinidia rufa]|uniref:Zinc finger (CCCH-type) family protein n=1 Tax=Actinidia rufa TaxID=165716 RepID=A0A7J0H4D1_9ERIC|nr:zinc finger (CCCH-type) family protein [Actinidia rufa]
MDDDLTPVCSASKARSARDVVTPLAYMPYIDQLERKINNLMQTLKRLVREAHLDSFFSFVLSTKNACKACPNGVPLPEWILKSREIGGLPCVFEGILESPLVNGYCNKCEFSVGYSIQGKPTVGFMLGNFRLNNTGFWRQLTVSFTDNSYKSSAMTLLMQYLAFEKGELQARLLRLEILRLFKRNIMGFDDGLVNSEFEKMAQAFSVGASANSPSPLTALLVQDHKGISNVAPADAPLRSIPISKAGSHSGQETGSDGAEARINDYIGNLRFCISPTAFLQVNTLAANKLYSLAGDWAGLGPDS